MSEFTDQKATASQGSRMSGIKRDYKGNKKDLPHREVPRNEYTSMFEGFRNELDKHHDRREKIVKVSRDVTALSKKMYVAPVEDHSNRMLIEDS